MSPKRRRGSKATPQRICAFCGAGISEARPVFLVALAGKIIGPYHAGCAARLALVHKGKSQVGVSAPGVPFGFLPTDPSEGEPSC